MSDDELLQEMWAAWHSCDGPYSAAMRAVLDVLHANGYRRCAEGQRSTQWCGEVERVRANLKALEDEHIAYAEDVGDALGQGEDEPLLTCARRVMAEVERLRERNAEWERKASAWMASPEATQWLDGYRELAQKVNAAEAEVERLRADAERYRWLRDVATGDEWDYIMTTEDTDAAIDAARGGAMSRIINGREYFCGEEIEQSFTRWRDARIEELEAEVEQLRADAERRLRDWNWEMGRRCDVEREVLRLKEYLSEAREQAEQFKQQWVLCRAEVERLRAVIEAAPHSVGCNTGYLVPDCNCWKAARGES